MAGNNIDVTYNDGSNTFTIDVEGLTSADISDFAEAAQDAVGTMVSATGVGVDLVYADATPSLTANLDINGLTEDTTPDTAADYLATYDASAGTHKKVLLDNLGLTGGGGGGGSTTLTPDVDEDLLSSIANWTQVSGTWAAGGSYTDVTPGSGGQARLKYNNTVAQADITVEVEFYHRSDAPTYADDDAGMGIKLAWDGAGNGDIFVGASFSNNTPQDIRVEQEGPWSDSPGPYDVYRGSNTSSASWLYNLSCLSAGVTGSSVIDAGIPAQESFFYYRVSRMDRCRESLLGRDSTGASIPNTAPCVGGGAP